ncbi:MAG: non-hydrolyzing UDP-N-acetylglucosamine 2-epimerase, partial [Actinomycetota bacterium]
MIKVLSVFGTRPEAIKMAPVMKELGRHPDHIISRVCVTGQHRAMLDQVLDLFDITPDHDLDIMQAGQSPTQVAAAVMSQLEPVLAAERPDWVLVQGDTTTVTAAALACFYARIKIGHVEAGLRSFDDHNPFPEEMNRRLASTMTDLHFAPTEGAQDNLLLEGVAPERIVVTGNPVIDALRSVSETGYDSTRVALKAAAAGKRLVFVTSHRRENFGTPLENICRAALRISRTRDTHVVMTVHPNPQVQNTLVTMLGDEANITLLPPLDYVPLVHLLQRCDLVLTDSGGLQEEAPSLGKPVLVLRDTTERPEGVKAGTCRLVGT